MAQSRFPRSDPVLEYNINSYQPGRIIAVVIRSWTIAGLLAKLCLAQDPALVLGEARSRVVQATRKLPRFTCLETVDREYFDTPQVGGVIAPAAQACPAIFKEPDAEIPQWTDRLRLEVTVADGREIHAWPTASEFDTRPIEDIVEGPITTGGFGGYLADVFDNAGTKFTSVGERAANGKKLFEYAYRTPLASSHYYVGKTHWLTGHGGWFLIDPGALELVRLVIHTDPLPPWTGACQDHNTIDFHRVPVGDGQLILPVQAVMQILEPGGTVSKTTSTYSSCHEYQAESTIRFDDADSQQRGTPAAQRRVPAAVQFTLRTRDTIDFNTAAAGDPIVAHVVRSSNRRALPQGATVSGRISVLRHFIGLNRYQLAFTVETLTVNGVSTRLSAIPQRARTTREAPAGFRNRGIELAIPPPESSSQAASFYFPGKASVVKAGFESLWVTVR